MKNEKVKINWIDWSNQRREELRKWAIKVAGGCDIQSGAGDKKNYPCGTCFNSGLGRLLKEKNPLYKEHNKPVDRINEIWRGLLQIRDEKYQK